MDLWIRSQDKTKLVKIDNISYMDMAEDMDTQIHSLWNDCKGILGTYKTKERALEVLDEIQNILFYKKMSEDNIVLFSKIISEKYGDELKNKIYMDTAVYKMPKE